MPSPRYTLSENSAAAFCPMTSNSALIEQPFCKLMFFGYS
jgi:hypothetical protein